MEHFSFNRDTPGKNHSIMIKRVSSSKAHTLSIQTSKHKKEVEGHISTITVESLNRLLLKLNGTSTQ